MSLKPKKQTAKKKKHEQPSKRPKVHGLRTCLQCKGICHEGSLRQKGKQGTGGRAHYFCWYGCLKNYYSLKFMQELKEIFRRHGKMDEFEAHEEKQAQDIMKRYEYVDVITE